MYNWCEIVGYGWCDSGQQLCDSENSPAENGMLKNFSIRIAIGHVKTNAYFSG